MKPKRRIVLRPINQKCNFCEVGKTPDYKDYEALRTYVTERGKLVGRTRTGLCQKHQRRLGVAVKRARHLARLPYVATLA